MLFEPESLVRHLIPQKWNRKNLDVCINIYIHRWNFRSADISVLFLRLKPSIRTNCECQFSKNGLPKPKFSCLSPLSKFLVSWKLFWGLLQSKLTSFTLCPHAYHLIVIWNVIFWFTRGILTPLSQCVYCVLMPSHSATLNRHFCRRVCWFWWESAHSGERRERKGNQHAKGTIWLQDRGDDRRWSHWPGGLPPCCKCLLSEVDLHAWLQSVSFAASTYCACAHMHVWAVLCKLNEACWWFFVIMLCFFLSERLHWIWWECHPAAGQREMFVVCHKFWRAAKGTGEDLKKENCTVTNFNLFFLFAPNFVPLMVLSSAHFFLRLCQ